MSYGGIEAGGTKWVCAVADEPGRPDKVDTFPTTSPEQTVARAVRFFTENGPVEILGEDYGGVLERDGWAPYRRFQSARHQTCAAHLLRRTGELISSSVAGQARVPHAARRILKDALALRDQRDGGTPAAFRKSHLAGLAVANTSAPALWAS